MFAKGDWFVVHKKYLAEFIGTFFLVFIGDGAIIINI